MPPGSRPVLVAEDDPDSRDAVVELLRVLGLAVVAAPDGREALRRIREGLAPCLILPDLMLPDMDGWQLTREIKRDPTLAVVPLVVLSAHPDARQARSTMGVDAALQKPVKPEQLEAVVKTYCPEVASTT